MALDLRVCIHRRYSSLFSFRNETTRGINEQTKEIARLNRKQFKCSFCAVQERASWRERISIKENSSVFGGHAQVRGDNYIAAWEFFWNDVRTSRCYLFRWPVFSHHDLVSDSQSCRFKNFPRPTKRYCTPPSPLGGWGVFRYKK